MLELLCVLGLGVVWWWLHGLKRRVVELETTVELLLQAQAARGVARPSGVHDDAVPAPVPVPSGFAPTLAPNAPAMALGGAMAGTGAMAGIGAVPVSTAAADRPSQSQPSRRAETPVADDETWELPIAAQPARPAQTDWIRRATDAVKGWFTTGNVPVKVGMLVLLAGVAALLRYASAQGWVRVPVEARLLGIGAVALAGLGFGWYQRLKKPVFAQALQGGALGAFLLTVFAAYKLYSLLGAGTAFGISAALIAAVAVMAVKQNALSLAMLSVLAGFLAPIWLSSGSGNHVALFSYYALLNAGIFAIAWVRPWRVLFLMGFGFTWMVGIVWGVLQYAPAKFASTEPFLLLFFFFYLALPILYARKAPAQAGDRLDGSLLFGTPLIAFGVQSVLLDGARWPLAGCALGLAALYGVLAWQLWPRARYAALARVHAVLAVGFATLAIPLALSASSTACAFALEGAGLVWLGVRQQRRLPQWTGFVLQLAAAAAWVLATVFFSPFGHHAVANVGFASGMVLALAGFAMAWVLWQANTRTAASLAYAWGLLWWLSIGLREIDLFAPAHWQAGATLMWLGLTGWLASEWNARRALVMLICTALGGLLVAFPIALWLLNEVGAPLTWGNAVAWLVFGGFAVRSLMAQRHSDASMAAWGQLGLAVLWPLLISLSVGHWVRPWQLASAWHWVLPALPVLAAGALALWRWEWLRWPVGPAANGQRLPYLSGVVAVLAMWWVLALGSSGAVQPLPWVPVLNPLDLAQLATLALAARWLWGEAPRQMHQTGVAVLAGAAFVLVTCIDLRLMHHWGGVAWGTHMLSSSLVQTSLTVLWSALGVLGWVWGSRRGHRMLWLAGAVLMGVVLVKLLLVDRQNLGDLLGIGAFIAYGLLCTVVGWLAPAPPKAEQAVPEAA